MDQKLHGYLVVANKYALTNPVATGHQSHLVYHKVVYWTHYYFLCTYVNDIDTNIVSKMSKFADDPKLCHSARNTDYMTELQDDINKLVEWSNNWQINFNVDRCSVMHIGYNNIQGNYNMFNQ